MSKSPVVSLLLLVLVGCQPDVMVDDTYDFDDYREFREKIAGAETVVVYEGLPHPMFEGEAYEAEIAKANHLDIDKHAFYKGAVTLKSEQAIEILRLFTNDGNVIPFTGFKTCGSFHPDYMAEWTIGNEKFRAHACFNCGEIMAIGPGIDTIADMGDDSMFEKVLSRYRDKRPAVD